MDRRLRADLSDKLTYWFKPSVGDVAGAFAQAVQQGVILGSKPDYILGDRVCVAFTETPLSIAGKLLSGAKAFNINFAPVGFLIDRAWLFAQGARPVIYQTAEEAELLAEEQKYRHVTLDPNAGIDFTWKREWRIPQDKLAIDWSACQAIVPDRKWLEQIRSRAGGDIDARLSQAIVLEALQ